MHTPNLVLAGFMGTGKTTVGRIVAERLGMPFIDTDALIEAEAGASIQDLFSKYGEPHFRAIEREVCIRVADGTGQVIAIGGGALLDYDTHVALERQGVLVLLTCDTETLLARLEESALRGERPMLGGDFRGRIAELLEARKSVYGRVPLRVDTTHITPDEAASQVVSLFESDEIAWQPRIRRHLSPGAVHVRSPEAQYNIFLGRDLLANINMLVSRQKLGRKVIVVSDSTVAPLYAQKVLASLAVESYDAHLVEMPAGEVHKTQHSLDLLVDGFLDAGLDRSGWVLALGGGVVGDTAGFAASIYMRGVPLVQVPTTLLAMADSSIGGKVGIDHPRGKNLLGAFKQPRMVVCDLDTLVTLPPEQVACGMAEIIKAGIIADAGLFAYLEVTPPVDIDYEGVLLRAITVKRDIVERDPYEVGDRAFLNLGHTFGHAFEKCTSYSRLHGFAVAQGMVVAARLAGRLGICEPSLEERLRALLEKRGLPVRWGPPDLVDGDAVDRVMEAMRVDKKRRDGELILVLPEAVGRVRLVTGVAEDAVRSVLREAQ